jgi:Ca2+:H+ antiporter
VCHGVLLTAAVNVMTYVVGDGKSNWLEGAILICLFPSILLFVVSQQPIIWVRWTGFYINIAVSFWFYPGSTYSSTLGRCTADLR